LAAGAPIQRQAQGRRPQETPRGAGTPGLSLTVLAVDMPLRAKRVSVAVPRSVTNCKPYSGSWSSHCSSASDDAGPASGASRAAG
jgi:hypothetical protein